MNFRSVAIRRIASTQGRCGWSPLRFRRFYAPPMSDPNTHPAKKLKTAETQKVTRLRPYSETASLTVFFSHPSLRSSARTTEPFIAMKPLLSTYSGKHRLMPMQVCHVNPDYVLCIIDPLFNRLDPNERPGNLGYMRYRGRRRSGVRRKPKEIRPPPTRFRRDFRSWIPNETVVCRTDLQVRYFCPALR